MTVFWHELRQGRTAFVIWTASIAFLLVICIFLFPEIKDEMGTVGNMFASMGSFTAAFGMERLNIGTLTGFYSIECGNILGLGGAFFASLTGASIISKEEKDKTAEFLLTHPVSRIHVITEKLAAVLTQAAAMDLIIFILSVLSIRSIGEDVPWKEILLLHGAYYLLWLELAGICFGLSAFLCRGSMGIGLGLAAVMYFLNLVANISKQAEFLKYVTPFAYCEGADILSDGCLDIRLVLIGMSFAGIGIAAAYIRYAAKDIHG